MKTHRWILTAALAGVAAAAWATEAEHKDGPAKAIAVVQGAKDSGVGGTVTFVKAAEGVKVTAHLTGLKPGPHGFHIHEFGDCSAADFTSAGGHFNPAGQPHAAPTETKRHAGDLGNVEAGPDGVAHLEWTDAQMHLQGEGGVLGRAVIVHANADDLKTQPTGNAGGRVGCGVIGRAKTE